MTGAGAERARVRPARADPAGRGGGEGEQAPAAPGGPP